MSSVVKSQRTLLLEYLSRRTLARARDLRGAGVSATTISRALEEGSLVRISRGLYQRADAETDADISLAEAAVRVPGGVICLSSALAFHGLTELLPRRVWIAIGAKSWSPKVSPVVRILTSSHCLKAGNSLCRRRTSAPESQDVAGRVHVPVVPSTTPGTLPLPYS